MSTMSYILRRSAQQRAGVRSLNATQAIPTIVSGPQIRTETAQAAAMPSKMDGADSGLRAYSGHERSHAFPESYRKALGFSTVSLLISSFWGNPMKETWCRAHQPAVE
mmetsp:Transcript_1568/g.2815  ORF Transcript_1568/g.2815 Transcript_1568/m.2815 type:complete len:108 (+) Transcript_1568:65-388(+)